MPERVRIGAARIRRGLDQALEPRVAVPRQVGVVLLARAIVAADERSREVGRRREVGGPAVGPDLRDVARVGEVAAVPAVVARYPEAAPIPQAVEQSREVAADPRLVV